MAMMDEKRKELHDLITAAPSEKLKELEGLIRILTLIPEEKPTEEEMKIIEQAEKEFENGETYSFEAVFRDE
ncbi:hypothetical protein [Bacillus sp. REN16]|uniref:hypothetical protein n=1 Tax=Bacillus sp. REN16 TaxID=2887296 RepID=UPI001E4BD958|nr:hypothetical protein [Bacillus sp. REN16]MCC3357758.1 hypothetical protein [Bacillus sp. REN16]